MFPNTLVPVVEIAIAKELVDDISDKMSPKQKEYTPDEVIVKTQTALNELLKWTEEGLKLTKKPENKKYLDEKMRPVYESYQKSLGELIAKYNIQDIK